MMCLTKSWLHRSFLRKIRTHIIPLPTSAYKQATQRVSSCLKPREKPSKTQKRSLQQAVTAIELNTLVPPLPEKDIMQELMCPKPDYAENQSCEFKLLVHYSMPSHYNQRTQILELQKKRKRKKVTLSGSSSILPNRKWLFLVQRSNNMKVSSESPDGMLGRSCETIS